MATVSRLVRHPYRAMATVSRLVRRPYRAMATVSRLVRRPYRATQRNLTAWMSPKALLLLLLTTRMCIGKATVGDGRLSELQRSNRDHSGEMVSPQVQPAFTVSTDDHLTCPTGTRKCVDRGMCLAEWKFCDGIPHCTEWKGCEDYGAHCLNTCDVHDECMVGEDEINCKDWTCSSGYRKCADNNRVCWPESWFCDGIKNCGDNSDENPDFCRTFNCAVNYRKCAENNRCVHERYICDTSADCPSGSDETNCDGASARFTAHTDNHTYWFAAKECRKKGLRLAQPLNWRDNNGILIVTLEHRQRYWWIGIKRIHPNPWYYENGTKLGDWNAWSRTPTTRRRGDHREHCACYDDKSANWTVGLCLENLPYVCETIPVPEDNDGEIIQPSGLNLVTIIMTCLLLNA